MSESSIAVEIKNLFFEFDSELLFEDFNLEIKKGSFTCILGRSGCGKSSLLKLIQGIYRPQRGSIVKKLESTIAFQQSPLFPWMSVYENLLVAIPDKYTQTEKKKLFLRI